MKLIWEENLEKWVFIDCILAEIVETEADNKKSIYTLHMNCF